LLSEKVEEAVKAIRREMRARGSLLVALSGGLDSSVVAALAKAALGERAVAATIASPLTPSYELADARRVAAFLGMRHLTIWLDELRLRGVRENGPRRCYACKRYRYEEILQVAEALGLRAVADGTTASDVGQHRPGLRAVEELGIYTPLLNHGLTRAEVRELARQMGLPTAEKAPNSCLATRFPPGHELRPEELRQVERVEDVLRELLGPNVLVRARRWGRVLRLELLPPDMPLLLEEDTRKAVLKAVERLGLGRAVLDLVGYPGHL